MSKNLLWLAVSVSLLSVSARAEQRADESGESSTYVHINAGATRVRLMRVAGTSYGQASTGQTVVVTHVEDVCGSPCDRAVARAESQFYVGGDDVPASDTFRIDGYVQGVNLNVKTGSHGLFILGRVLTYLGLPVAITGVTFVVLSFVLESLSGWLMPGVAVAIGGAAMMGAGIPLAIANATRVEVAPRAPSSPPAPNVMPVTVTTF